MAIYRRLRRTWIYDTVAVNGREHAKSVRQPPSHSVRDFLVKLERNGRCVTRGHIHRVLRQKRWLSSGLERMPDLSAVDFAPVSLR